VRTGCHGATDLSPVCMAAALHFDLSVHNLAFKSTCGTATRPIACFLTLTRSPTARFYPGESRGSVDIDEELAKQYPYDRAYLPRGNRKLDGTMHSW